jgi:hypothetical protein
MARGGRVSDKGRWYRIYARQVEEHDKFADLTGVELGAWMALRSAAELRDKATIRDRAEAVLILKRRSISKPAAILDKLILRGLFDVDEKGRITVHDRADHDRPQYPSDSPEAAAERKRRSRAKEDGHEDVPSRDGDSHDTHAGVQPQPSSPATANSPQPQPSGLPGPDDSATLACRFFLNGGQWLGNEDYILGWEELDRRFGDWVKPEIQASYTRLHEQNPKVKPWSLLRAVEMALAERARADELEKERAEAEAVKAERKRLEEKAAAATEEDKRRASITRRAIGLWIKRRPNDAVPTDFDQLEAWLAENEPKDAAA